MNGVLGMLQLTETNRLNAEQAEICTDCGESTITFCNRDQ